MLAIFFFIIAFAFCLGTLAYRRDWHCPGAAEVLLGFVLLFNMGITSLLAAYAHLFMGPLIAEQIGWLPGSPFQFEIGMANLSYGILGVLAFWFRGRFWDAAIIGWSIFLLGCFAGHLHDYLVNGNNAPLNIGIYIWFNDLILPIFMLATLYFIRLRKFGSAA